MIQNSIIINTMKNIKDYIKLPTYYHYNLNNLVKLKNKYKIN